MSPTAEPPTILAVGTALPDYVVTQAQVSAALHAAWEADHSVERGRLKRIAELHRATGVRQRHFVLPLERYPTLGSFAQRNALWQDHALTLAERAVRDVLSEAAVSVDELDQLTFVSVTGIAAPSLDARLMNRLGLRPDVRRTPVFGLGCVAGAAGLVRAQDYLRAYPTHLALLVSAELCSLTFQLDDHGLSNIVATGLFGDGAAAVLVAGAQWAAARGRPPPRGLPRIVATRSALYPHTERVMGWDIVDTGFRVVLSPEVPELVRQRMPQDADGLLASAGLSRGSLRHWVMHTGGPKVLEAIEQSLALPDDALRGSWDSLAAVGNLSSASVLFVLQRALREGRAQVGDLGLLGALGPGFCSELALLRW
jgi:alkylresorcinol/alkylpyrone synthase